jgi:hypothetical protein
MQLCGLNPITGRCHEDKFAVYSNKCYASFGCIYYNYGYTRTELDLSRKFTISEEWKPQLCYNWSCIHAVEDI